MNKHKFTAIKILEESKEPLHYKEITRCAHLPEFWNIVVVQLPEYDKARTWLRKYGKIFERGFWI